MIKIINLTNEPHQIHEILFSDAFIALELRFFETTKRWSMNVSYKDRAFNGINMCLGARLLSKANLPFDLVIYDTSANGIDPFLVSDFRGRVAIYLIEPEEILSIRGYDVEI